MIRILIFSSLIFLSMTQEKVHVLYRSLDPQSIAKHLAFYQLFPNTQEGKRALSDAWMMLSGGSERPLPLNQLPQNALQSIITLITKGEGVETAELSGSDLATIETLSAHLPHQKLKGHFAQSEKDILSLDAEEIDLAHALLLAQAEDNPTARSHIRSYEALIDLMALQILTRVKLDDSPEKKIRAINQFVFEEMGYRFPPHSVYAKDIDLYTYLPSVMDSRRGVCLGVSILYLCLSQRLNLPLEAITPPGHIYVRYVSPEKTINIETTARGIHLDTEEYLGVESTDLPKRTIKDVVGLAYFNEASVHWQNQNYVKALKCYERAATYIPDEPLLIELMGYNYLFVGEHEKGRALIEQAYNHPNSYDPIMQKGVMEDFLTGKADAEAIRTLYMHVDENRSSLLKKKDALMQTIHDFPYFRAAYFHLAIVWAQLHRLGNALTVLQNYVRLEPNDPSVEYMLSQLYAIRSNFPEAWKHLHHAEELLKDREKPPKTLKMLHRELAKHSPE